jgi:SNF family Na+-dependent transporter
MIVTTLDTITSVLSACIVYCILGNLMYELNTDDINISVRGGPGLVFVIYAEAIAKFDAVPQVSDILCISVG